MPPSQPEAGPPAVVVLMSFGPPHVETNPYLVQLVDSLPPSVVVQHFTWRQAILGSYDVFHLHWPEVRLRGTTPLRSLGRGVLFLLLLLRIRAQGLAVVRTLHNVAPHEPPTVPQALLLGLCDRWTTLTIRLSDHVTAPIGLRSVRIPHGHYRDWFRSFDVPEPVPGRLLHFGLVRRYKGVESLLAAFTGLADPSWSLRVVGKQIDPAVGDAIARAVGPDPRVSAADGYVDDAQLAAEIGESELVVLPAAGTGNSGSLLLALSLGRPVLVPRTPSTEALGAEVGDGWVRTYDGTLTAPVLAAALAQLRSAPPTGSPDLDAREWSSIGVEHALAYRDARVTVARRRSGAVDRRGRRPVPPQGPVASWRKGRG